MQNWTIRGRGGGGPMTASVVARILISKVGRGRYHVVTVNAEGCSMG